MESRIGLFSVFAFSSASLFHGSIYGFSACCKSRNLFLPKVISHFQDCRIYGYPKLVCTPSGNPLIIPPVAVGMGNFGE